MDALVTRRPVPEMLSTRPVGDIVDVAPDDATCDLVLDLGSGGHGSDHLVLTFDGVADPLSAISAVLGGRAPTLAFERGGSCVASALPAIEAPHALGLSLAMVFGRVADLAAMAVRAAHAPSPSVRQASAPGSAALAASAARFALTSLSARIATRLDRLLRTCHIWQVGWTNDPLPAIPDQPSLDAAGFRWLASDGQRFYADPFGIRVDGRLHLFVEEFPFATQRGVISHVVIEDSTIVAQPAVVLERPYHLSYPFVFERDGAMFMIPETGANRTIELYRADPFPNRWILDRVLVRDAPASDATLIEHDGRQYLFATVARPGVSTWDTLEIFHAESLFGDWRPHALNPLLIDAARARPAGAMFRTGGRLIRPVQDCVTGYGAALRFMTVDCLTAEAFAQTDHLRLSPLAPWQGSGLHTFNRVDGVSLVDRLAPPIAGNYA